MNSTSRLPGHPPGPTRSTPHEHGAQIPSTDEKIHALLDRITTMETSPAPPLRNLEESADVRYSIDVARRLSELECEILAQATQLREEGLRHSRTGATSKATDLIEHARALLEGGGLSAEAYLLGDSFQLAAEAFLRYRAADYEHARQLLLVAMADCRDLFLDYGYDVAMRRVHLGRNIVRIVHDHGEPTEALHLARGIIRYIERDRAAWPWPEFSVNDGRRLTLDMRHALMDQVLSEVARATRDPAPDFLTVVDSTPGRELFATTPVTSEFTRAHAWLSARDHAARSEWDQFADSAQDFFSEPPGRYGTAWRALTRDAHAAARSITGGNPA